MRLALVSLDQRWKNKEENFRRCADFVRKAKVLGSDVVAFPEMTLTAYSLDVVDVVEREHGSQTLQKFSHLADDAKVDVVFGACLAGDGLARPRNTLCVARRNGETLVCYSKMHPFTFAGEEKVFEAGNSLAVVQLGDLRLGCSICYDLRFPELFAAMASQCNAVINIANWPAGRVSHWRALLVARAIENQLFVIGVNRTGVDGNGLQYEMSSMAVAPDGTVLAPTHSEPEMAIYDVDPAMTHRHREAFPTVRDKRRELYRHLAEGILKC